MQSKARGSVLSSEPVYLRRAARHLSRFADSETGARPEIVAYVRRASKAFDELVQFHFELQHKRSGSEVHGGEQDGKHIKRKTEADGDTGTLRETENGEVVEPDEEKVQRRKKRKFTSAEKDLEEKSRSLEGRNEEEVMVEKEVRVQVETEGEESCLGRGGRRKKNKMKNPEAGYQ